jgi:ribosomal protein S18 acetylase RimI-like enzyme
VVISIPDLEQRAALGWRAPEEARVGDWLLRAAGGFTGRANSALAVGDPGRPLGQAADAVCDWYRARGLAAMIAIPYPAAGGPRADPVDRFLAGQGWGVRSGAATVMIAPAARIAQAAGPVPAAAVAIDPEPDEAWLALYHYRGQQGLPPIARQVLTSAPWQAFASIRAAGQTIAIGRVAAAGGWAGLTAIEVAPGHRRRGLATVVTAALAVCAAAHGAGHLYLQVEDGNEAARALYRRIGFAAHHGYHYRVAPTGQGGGPAPGRLSPLWRAGTRAGTEAHSPR